MAQLPPQGRPRNAISHSPSGDSYTGLGCFPLGHHTTPAETAALTQTARSLRESKALHQVSPATYDAITAQLAPLREAQSFWARHARDAHVAHAVRELLELLDAKSPALAVYVLPESPRLGSVAPVVWGLAEVDIDVDVAGGKTYLYISGGQADLAGVVLHTFLSSRRVSRLQCFLAEYVLADQAGRLTADWALPARLQEELACLGREELRVLGGRLDGEGRLEAPVLLAKLAGLCEELVEKGEEPVLGGVGGRGGRGGGVGLSG
ncbi:hypothetical protein PMIN03_003863 [Paraphaeosphaeria minitans]